MIIIELFFFLLILSPVVLISVATGFGYLYLVEDVGQGWASLVGAAIGVASVVAFVAFFLLFDFFAIYLSPFWVEQGEASVDDWDQLDWFLSDIVVGMYLLSHILAAIFTYLVCQRRSRRIWGDDR